MCIWFNRTFASVYATIALIREADVAGKFHLIYSNTNLHAAASRVAHKFLIEPSGLDDPQYVEWCLHFCREQRISVFWPGRAANVISGARNRFLEQGTRVLFSADAQMLDLLHGKARFYAMVDLPIAPPAEWVFFETIEQFDVAYASLCQRYEALCVKPAKSVYGLGFSLQDDERSCARFLLEGKQYRISLDDFRRGLVVEKTFLAMFLMEYLDGAEYSVDCMGNEGDLLCAISRHKSSQTGQGQVIDMRGDILEATKQLTAAYSLNGIFNVQFKEEKGSLRVLEINPRMSGGIGMACIAIPKLPYLALHGFDQLVIPEVRANICVAELSFPVELAWVQF